MRTNEERVAAVKSRAAQLECQKRLRQKRLLALACACASLAVIVGAALALPLAMFSSRCSLLRSVCA